MRNTFSLLLILWSFLSYGQDNWSKKDKLKFEDAHIYYEITDYRSALDIYLPLYKKYKKDNELNFRIGACYYFLDNSTEALPYLEIAENQENPNAAYLLGQYYHRKENFDQAVLHFENYKQRDGTKLFDDNEADRMIRKCKNAEDLMSEPIQAVVYNLGDVVNSAYDDYCPLIKSDESLMAYTSRREGSTGEKKDPYGNYFEDIYLAEKKDDQWQHVVNAGTPLNSSTHDAAVGLSADGKSMIIYRTNEELTAGDLYISEFVDNAWTEPEKLSEAINSEYQEASACLTNDRRVIYFSSNRPGGEGGKDLYRVVKINANIWSLPLNLGPTINTPYDEDAPFLHPDGTTLYFSSKGHKNMGGFDIFRSSLREDYWSNPENIGYPANTVNDDIFFVLTGDQKRGYYSTKRDDGFGGHDIYAISFENEMESLRIIRGRIEDQSGNALEAVLELRDEDGELAGTFRSNALTGNYIVILPPDTDYSLNVRSIGYAEMEENIYYQGGTNERERIKNFTLVKTLEQ